MGYEASSGVDASHNYIFFPSNRGNDAGVGISAGKNGVNVLEHGNYYLPAVLVYQAALGSGWNHVAVTYGVDGAPVLYVNGVKVRTGVKSTKKKALQLDPNSEQIGKGAYGRFNGKIDEIRMYDRAISEAEVAAIFALEGGKQFANAGQSVVGNSFVLNGSGTLAFDWKQSLFEEASADWDKLFMRATTGTMAIPEDVTVAVAGMGKVSFFGGAIDNSGVVELDELAQLIIYNYARVGTKSQERLGRGAKLEKMVADFEPATPQRTSTP
jgi:hypothetical protein